MRFLSTHGETLLTALAFLACAYGCVYFVIVQRYGAAFYALLGAIGLFGALMNFLRNGDLLIRLRRMREEQRAQGFDS
ncbi:hypothetical protein [Variovorax sp. JS1663]|uniref:hypothetical protein n=1 Tax=Variovorax sp. JS1663 TaxID=1851577 RepID=UPI000B34199F|nr:hypothetical protein [Variovorax sp. JS1663]OUM00552.1 hypothetical protein A8M77_21020 [Variovorax sp. JS1663]